VKIYSSSETQEYYFKEGCHILELLNSSDDEDCSIARARVAPDQQTHFHKLLDTTERYLILSGSGEVTVGDKSTLVGVNDVVVIPAGVRQSIKNTGKEDLVFLAICTPRFKEQNYQFCE
jgi:mannose-6-phosphate isomerase-like protein (cupin superfamily)